MDYNSCFFENKYFDILGILATMNLTHPGIGF
jgi:hypothetical protein